MSHSFRSRACDREAPNGTETRPRGRAGKFPIRDGPVFADAKRLDAALAVDGRKITAQGPGDLPPFMAAVPSAAER